MARAPSRLDLGITDLRDYITLHYITLQKFLTWPK